MRYNVSKEDVAEFKEMYCNENELIADALKGEARPYMVEPILDVGAGNGDICYFSCPTKEVFLIDINEYYNDLNPELHKRYKIDFFDFIPPKQIHTLLISHTLQFIDDDMAKLNNRISFLNPENIILTLNDNDGFMGELLKWTNKNIEHANPEVFICNFPENYNFVKKIPIRAELVCDTFTSLAQQVSYLMLFTLTQEIEKKLTAFLNKKLYSPAFPINQSIYIYNKR